MSLAGTAFIDVRGDFSQFDRQGAAATAAFQKRMDSTWATAGQKLARSGQNMSRLGQQMTRTVTLPLLAVGAASVKAAADFEGAMTQVRTQAGASAGEIEKMHGSILKLSPAVGKTPVELANALFHIESSGIRGAKALDLLRNSAKLSQIGHADLEATTNALVAVMKSAPKDVKGASDAIGLLNAIVGQGNMRMEDLTAAMSTGILPAAKSVGLGLRDVGAAIDVMTARGVPAQDAATRLRMTFSLLSAPTAQAAKALKTVGIGGSDLARDLRKPDGLVVAVRDLKDHMDKAGLSAVQQNQLIAKAFGGGRSSSAILTLLQNVDDLQKRFEGIGKQSGASEVNKAWKETTHDLGFQFDQLKSDAVAAGAKIGAAIGPSVISFAKDVAHDASAIADAFSKLPKGAQETIVKGGLILAGIGPALRLAGVFTTGVGRLYNAALLIGKLGAGGGLLGKLRGQGGVGGAVGGKTATQAVGTMEVGTLVARSMVGGAGPGGRLAGAPPPIAGTAGVPGERPGRIGQIVRGVGGGITIIGLPIAGMVAGNAVGGQGGGVLKGAGIGAGAGALFGGPVGALAGAGIGGAVGALTSKNKSLFDTGKSAQFLGAQLRQLVGKGNIEGLNQLSAAAKKFGDKGIFDKGTAQATSRTARQVAIDVRGMNDAFTRLRHGVDVTFGMLATDIRKTMNGVADELRIAPAKGAKDAVTSFALISTQAKKMLHDGSITTAQYKDVVTGNFKNLRDTSTVMFQSIAHNMGIKTKAGTNASVSAISSYVGGVKSLLSQHVLTFDQAMSLINKAYMAEAKAFGLSAADVKSIHLGTSALGGKAGTVDGQYTPGGHAQARGGFAGSGPLVRGHAKGRFVGKPGEAGPDDTLLGVRAGTPILNRYQLAALGLFAGGGQVPVMVGRGEWVGEPESVPALNALAAARGFGSLAGLYSAVTRPHYAAKGGLAFPFPKGAHYTWNRIDQGLDIQGTPGQALLAMAAGVVRRASNPGGFGPDYPELQFDHPVKGHGGMYYGHTDITRRGHVSAGDVIARTSKTGHNAPPGWVELGFLPYGSMSAGNAIAPLLHALAGGAQIANAIAQIKVPKITGPNSPLTAITRAAVKKVARGANSRLASLAPSISGGAPNADAGKASGPWLSVLADFAHSHGWSIPDWKWLTGHESSNVPSKMNPSGHFGLGQLSRDNQRKYHAGPGSSPAQQIIAMGQYIADRYGNPSRAKAFWQGHGYYGPGGIAGRFASGGIARAATGLVAAGRPLFTREGPRYYDAAYKHNRPFAVSGPYRTRLRAGQERTFREWLHQHHVPFNPDARISDYDMRGFWLSGGRWQGGHFPDTWKTPYDTSFSHESRYATRNNPFYWHGNRLIDRRNGQVVFASRGGIIGALQRFASGGIVGGAQRAATGLIAAGVHHTAARTGHKHLHKLDKARKALLAPFAIKDVGDFSHVTDVSDADLRRLDSQESLLERFAGVTLPDGTNQTVLGPPDVQLLAATFPPTLTAGETIVDAQTRNRTAALGDMQDKVAKLKGALFVIGTAIGERDRRKKLVQDFLAQQFKRYQTLSADLADLKSSSAQRRLSAATDKGRRTKRINQAKDTIAHYQGLIADEQAKGKHADKGQINAWRQKIRDEDDFIRKEREQGNSQSTSAQVTVARDRLTRQLKPVQDDLDKFGGSRTSIGRTGFLGTITDDLSKLGEEKTSLVDAVTQLVTSDIPNIKLDIQALGAKPPATPDATTADDHGRADMLQQLLDQAHLALSVSQKQYDVLKVAPPFGGSFAEGGVVPGPVGSPRMIVAHGGETVTPAGGDGGSVGDVHLHFAPGTEWLRDFVRVEVDRTNRSTARHVGRGLPGRGGGVLSG